MRSRLDLPEPFEPEHADLGAGKERQRDVLEDDALGRHDLAHAVHRVDVLSHGGEAEGCVEPAIIAGPGAPRREFAASARENE